MLIFDTDNAITNVIPSLLKLDQDLRIIRYIAPGGANAWKCITPTEARAIAAQAGRIKIGFVFETNGRPRGSATGESDGKYARSILVAYGVPVDGTAFVAYASDEDEPAALSALTDAFTAFFAQLKQTNGSPGVRRAAYAAGATCDHLKSLGIIDISWLTQSDGFTGTKHDLSTGNWDLHQLLPKKMCGLDTDPDVQKNPTADLGFFIPKLAEPALPDEVLPQKASIEDVEALQAALNAKNNAGLTVDGRYGPATTDAVEAFQKPHGLTVDGIAGTQTIAVLKGLA